ncbi:hypothetical protein [Streptomyces candidus]|uniref:Uncharacterized protein n=1 Tax=Streptomyces candidus TaxID=67283 RepID=A0A7X0HB97_9ACTN|nr:hypothetical protein [Streptomyces candidus]MBB6434276.1 hypothetical protein [Streptomyces candidus]GHH37281.1 hypothetical protein GCM10018773_13810 [Streptomyces candidus]
MSDTTPVPAAGVPQFTGNLATLERHITALRKDGAKLATQGKSTHTTFQGLSAYYKAPEADRLFATTTPVSTTAHDIGADMGTIADALETYATEVRPLAKRLAELKADAQTFANAAAADDTWREDGDKVEENNERRDEISRTLEAFWTAEIECHSKIVKLVNGKTYSLNDGSKSDHLYGYRADDLKGAKGLPWGDPVVESVRWYQAYEHVADFGTGVVVDGVWGTITGLGTLVGVNGWDAAGEAWTGLAKLATGVAVMAVPGASLALSLHGGEEGRRWVKDSQTALKETGKALVAWDQWGSNPGRAAGLVTFNVVTTVFTGGVGAGVSGAGKAGAVAKALSVAGKAGRVIDPTTYVFKAGAYTGIKIGDLFGSLKNAKQVDVGLPPGTIELPEGTLRNADGTVTLPADAAPPKGAVAQPNGTYTLTDDAVPAGSLRNPDGSGTYLTPGGDVINGKGEVLARVEDAPGDVVNTPATRAETPNTPSRAEAPSTPSRAETPAPKRVLVSVGADTPRAAHGGTGQLGDVAGVGDNTPRNSVGTVGGGRAGGSLPDDSIDVGGRGGSHDLPGRAGAASGGGGDDFVRGGEGGVDSVGPADDLPGRTADEGAHADGGRPAPGQEGGQPLDPAREIMRRQVDLANSNPEWFKEHYRSNGYRRFASREVFGQRLPTLVRDLLDSSKWMSKSDLPPAVGASYVAPEPHKGYAANLGGDALDELNKQAAVRHQAIAEDRLAEARMDRAEADYAVNPTEELAAARDAAEADHSPIHGNSRKQSEVFGEMVTEHHAIPEHFPGYTRVDDGAFGNNRFDQVYVDQNGNFVVAEAKGSTGASLGDRIGHSGKRVEQGTREYFETILDEMKKRANKKRDVVELKLQADLRQALDADPPKVRYVLVKADSTKAGSYAGYQMKEFNIKKKRE